MERMDLLWNPLIAFFEILGQELLEGINAPTAWVSCLFPKGKVLSHWFQKKILI